LIKYRFLSYLGTRSWENQRVVFIRF